MVQKVQGGCRCRAALYEIDLTNAHTLACHCTDCQKHLGAPYSIFTQVPADQFRWLQKPDGEIAFSKIAKRLFCKQCGTYLKWEGSKATHEAEINIMTLDDPQHISIDEEIFIKSRLPWIEPLDGIPQHQKSRTE